MLFRRYTFDSFKIKMDKYFQCESLCISVSLKLVDEKLVDKAWDLLWVHSDVERDMEGKLKV